MKILVLEHYVARRGGEEERRRGLGGEEERRRGAGRVGGKNGVKT